MQEDGGGPSPVSSYQRSVTAVDVSCRGVEFEHVLVVGAGQMGGGIAQVAASAGCGVSLHDAAPGATDQALETIRRSAAKLAEKGDPIPTRCSVASRPSTTSWQPT